MEVGLYEEGFVMKNIQHSSKSDRWFTPKHIINMVHEVIGEPDLDPSSEEESNQIIKAKTFITEEQDGLTTPWVHGSVFLNPAGGKINNKSMSALFWAKLMEHKESGLLTEAIYIGFSIEQLSVTQKYHKLSMLDFPICVPSERIRFDSPDGEKNAPSHANCIVYVSGIVDHTDKFIEVFSRLGKCKR